MDHFRFTPSQVFHRLLKHLSVCSAMPPVSILFRKEVHVLIFRNQLSCAILQCKHYEIYSAMTIGKTSSWHPCQCNACSMYLRVLNSDFSISIMNFRPSPMLQHIARREGNYNLQLSNFIKSSSINLSYAPTLKHEITLITTLQIKAGEVSKTVHRINKVPSLLQPVWRQPLTIPVIGEQKKKKRKKYDHQIL